MYYIYNNSTKKMEATTEPWWRSGAWADAAEKAYEEELRRNVEPLFGSED